MRLKVPDAVLVVVVIVGGFFAWKTGRERSRLEATVERLTRKVGDLPIGDPTRVHIRALPTREPLHFAWRVYVPANYTNVLRSNPGSRSGVRTSSAREFVARVRFREDEPGTLHLFTHFSGSSMRMSFGDRSLAELVRDRGDKIAVEQLGVNDVTPIDPARPAVLLRLSLSEEMRNDARKTLSAEDQKRFSPVFFEWVLDSPGSNP